MFRNLSTRNLAAIALTICAAFVCSTVSAQAMLYGLKSGVPVPPDAVNLVPGRVWLGVPPHLKTTWKEKDIICYPDLIPDDPFFWGEWHHYTMHTPEAWDWERGSPRVIVAVCDTGVASHPDLDANIILPGYNSADGSEDTSPIARHGTLVAGQVGAVVNNGLGIAGMGNFKMVPVRVTNDPSGAAPLSGLVGGIVWAADRGVKVVNMSYDAPAGCAAINEAALYLRSKGGLLVCAAGSGSMELPFRPDYTSLIAVGASDTEDVWLSWSNYGPFVDCVAPGCGIGTTNPEGGYSAGTGTSASTALVSGLVALIWSVNPGFTPDIVESILYAGCVQIDDENRVGHGRIDAGRSVELAAGLRPPTTSTTTSATITTTSTTTSTAPVTTTTIFHRGKGWWRKHGSEQ